MNLEKNEAHDALYRAWRDLISDWFILAGIDLPLKIERHIAMRLATAGVPLPTKAP